jgi:hypothetical protein
MNQPTAEEALKKLEPLVATWRVAAADPSGELWPGEARASFEWHDSGAHLVHRSAVDALEAPSSISIIGCDRRRAPFTSSTPTIGASVVSTG